MPGLSFSGLVLRNALRLMTVMYPSSNSTIQLLIFPRGAAPMLHASRRAHLSGVN
jgi:hypothetical protein